MSNFFSFLSKNPLSSITNLISNQSLSLPSSLSSSISYNIKSSIEIEQIKGLKEIILSSTYPLYDISFIEDNFVRVLELTSKTDNTYVLCLCFFIIKTLSIYKTDKLLLTINLIDQAMIKRHSNSLNRFLTLIFVSSILNSGIKSEIVIEKVKEAVFDCNPLIRRTAFACLCSKYNKNQTHDETGYITRLINEEKDNIDYSDVLVIIKKSMKDQNFLVSSSCFRLLNQFHIKNYFDFNLKTAFENLIIKNQSFDKETSVIISSSLNKSDRKEFSYNSSIYIEDSLMTLSNFIFSFKDNEKYLFSYEEFLFNNINKGILSLEIHYISSIIILYKRYSSLTSKFLYNKNRVDLFFKTVLFRIGLNSFHDQQVCFLFFTCLNEILQVLYDFTYDFTYDSISDATGLNIRNISQYSYILSILYERRGIFKLFSSDFEFLLLEKSKILKILILSYKKLALPANNVEIINFYIDFLKYPSHNIKTYLYVINTIKTLCISELNNDFMLVAPILKQIIFMLKSKNELILSKCLSFLEETCLSHQKDMNKVEGLIISQLIFLFPSLSSSKVKSKIVNFLSRVIDIKPSLILNFYKNLCFDMLLDKNSSKTSFIEKVSFLELGFSLKLKENLFNDEDDDCIKKASYSNKMILNCLFESSLEYFKHDSHKEINERLRIYRLLLSENEGNKGNKGKIKNIHIKNQNLNDNTYTSYNKTSPDINSISMNKYIINQSRRFSYIQNNTLQYMKDYLKEDIKDDEAKEDNENQYKINDKYNQISKNDYNISKNIQNFSAEYSIADKQLEDYKIQLENQMDLLFNEENEVKEDVCQSNEMKKVELNYDDEVGEILYD